MSNPIVHDALLAITSFLPLKNAIRFGLCSRALLCDVWSRIEHFSNKDEDLPVSVSIQISAKPTALKSAEFVLISQGQIASCVDAIKRNHRTLQSLTLSILVRRRGMGFGFSSEPAADPTAEDAPAGTDILCQQMIDQITSPLKAMTRLVLLFRNLDDMVDNPSDIPKFWSLFPSLEFFYTVDDIGSTTLTQLQANCPHLQSLDCNAFDLHEFPDLVSRLTSFNFRSESSALMKSKNELLQLLSEQKYEDAASFLLTFSPPKVGLNLRQFNISIHLTLLRHCPIRDPARFCLTWMARGWQPAPLDDIGELLFTFPHQQPDDLVLQNIRTIIGGMTFDPLPYMAKLSQTILLRGRTELFKRFLVEFFSTKHSLELFVGLTSNGLPLICTPKLPETSKRYLGDANVIKDLASALSIDPSSQDYLHFANDIIGSVASASYIRNSRVYDFNNAPSILPYVETILRDPALLVLRDLTGFNFLHAVTSLGRKDLVAACIASPACPTLLKQRSHTVSIPLSFSLNSKQWEIANMLLDAGADPCATASESPLDGPVTDAILALVRDRSEISQMDMLRIDVISRLFKASPEPLRFFALCQMNSTRSYELDTNNLNALLPVDECVYQMTDPKLLYDVDEDLIEGSTDKSSLMSCAEAGALGRLSLSLKCGVGSDGDTSLLDARLKLKSRVGGWSVLHYAVAARENVVSVVQCLLEAGADPLAQSNHGLTPLDMFERVVGFAGGNIELGRFGQVEAHLQSLSSDGSYQLSRTTLMHLNKISIPDDVKERMRQLLAAPSLSTESLE